MDLDTIAAVATPVGGGGIGIVKISGAGAVGIARAVFRRPDGGKRVSFRDGRIHYGFIVNPETGSVLDEVLLNVMYGPRSYTREDIVEIQAHSGPINLTAIMELVTAQGARHAAPGEFTRRAFMNGRIDLTQAEGVIDYLTAENRKSLEIGASLLRGELKGEVETLRMLFLDILTRVNAEIDFPDEVECLDPVEVSSRIRSEALVKMEALIRTHREGEIFRGGFRIGIVGKPNVGKSSLMNRLARVDRAIVSPSPGTTRDLIETNVLIHGIPVILCDTAGLHPTHDPIEILGIEKTRFAITASDLVLFVVDGSRALTDEDREIFTQIRNKRFVVVSNKIDLGGKGEEPEIGQEFPKVDAIFTSALSGYGIEPLKDKIRSEAFGGRQVDAAGIVPNLRQKACLEKAALSAEAACTALIRRLPLELIAGDLGRSLRALDEILGIDVEVDVLDRIFERFCIGK